MSALLESPLRVYLVDDDRDTTECMRLLLQIWKHDVHVANDGATAIEQAPLIKPDLMMVDLAMPHIDGLEVARRVRQYRELEHTSLVAVSGYADPHHRELALTAGFEECLVKPVPPEHVLALLQRVRSRISAAKRLMAQAADAVVLSQERKAKSLSSLEVSGLAGTRGMPVWLQKSGISDVVCLNESTAAERLREWLKERGCRVGPVFVKEPGQWAFFNYSRHQLRSLLAGNDEYCVHSLER